MKAQQLQVDTGILFPLVLNAHEELRVCEGDDTLVGTVGAMFALAQALGQHQQKSHVHVRLDSPIRLAQTCT